MVAVYLCGFLTTCFWSCVQVVDWMGHLNIHVVKGAKCCLGLEFKYATSIKNEIMSVIGKWKSTYRYTNKCMFGTYLNSWWRK